jgi:hypothetical protein
LAPKVFHTSLASVPAIQLNVCGVAPDWCSELMCDATAGTEDQNYGATKSGREGLRRRAYKQKKEQGIST